jgi:tripartite-type tricarboxylate transporter receptor subunit TctC
VPNVTVISPDKNIKTLKDLVTAAKAGNLTFASAGVGSATHWAAERLRLSAGFQAVHVPFRGGPEALTEVMTGRVDFMCIGISSGLPLVRDGKLLALAVNTPKRSSALPNVPTTIEAGYTDSDYTFWNGMLVPAKTPREIVERLHAETRKALALPAVQEKFKPQGLEPMPVTPAEFDALIKKEIATNIALVKAAGLKFN